MRDEAGERVTGRAAGDLRDVEILGEEEVADGVHGIAAGFGHVFGQRPALPRLVRRRAEIPEPDVGPPCRAGRRRAGMAHLRAQALADTLVGKALEERHRPTGLHPLRKLDQQAGAGPLVRVGVEGHVLPAGSCLLHESQQLLAIASEGADQERA